MNVTSSTHAMHVIHEDEIDMAVAKTLGYQDKEVNLGSCGHPVYKRVWFPPGVNPDIQTAGWISEHGCSNPKRYSKSLDLCVEFETAIRKAGKISEYLGCLQHVMSRTGHDGHAACANARQRALGYLLCGTAVPYEWLIDWIDDHDENTR